MKTGKVSESVLKRSVLRQLKTNRDEVLLGAGIGEDCAILAFKEDEVFALSTDPVTGSIKDMGMYAVHTAANDLAASGAEPVGILLSVLLSEETEEAELKQIMAQAEETCKGLNMQIIGGHTEVTGAVNRAVLTVTGIGKAKKDSAFTTKGVRPGQDIVVSKWIGLEGTSIIAKEKETELLSKYPSHLVEAAAGFDQLLSVVPEAATAGKSNVTAMHDVTEGGIFGALWEFAESSGVGLEIDLKKIPIRQETIEVCEFFEINPYELISGGSLLMAADDGEELVRKLESAGIHGTVIGKIREGNDRVVINDDEKRFLEPPKPDEIYHII